MRHVIRFTVKKTIKVIEAPMRRSVTNITIAQVPSFL
jgi:hypothetical protein